MYIEEIPGGKIATLLLGNSGQGGSVLRIFSLDLTGEFYSLVVDDAQVDVVNSNVGLLAYNIDTSQESYLKIQIKFEPLAEGTFHGELIIEASTGTHRLGVLATSVASEYSYQIIMGFPKPEIQEIEGYGKYSIKYLL
jgi:hypothetical protein